MLQKEILCQKKDEIEPEKDKEIENIIIFQEDIDIKHSKIRKKMKKKLKKKKQRRKKMCRGDTKEIEMMMILKKKEWKWKKEKEKKKKKIIII